MVAFYRPVHNGPHTGRPIDPAHMDRILYCTPTSTQVAFTQVAPAPIWVLANFGDKRNSGTGAIWLVVQFGLDVIHLRVPYCVISRGTYDQEELLSQTGHERDRCVFRFEQ
ncbi:hypothetical protein J6590_088948 [Homalodisca vitripennis]|nr:hypothetical protein J6590_088948 [Homalodisca vitripennis]